ncbi:hypothetical protein AHAS_Ahas03G0167200 [Arachis hypogaea]
MSIIINGSPSDPFPMKRGLRQGDPISPFLFILVAEVLNRMLELAKKKCFIKGLEVGKDKIALFHLQFIDDTILFCAPDKGTLRNHRRILACFGIMSGLVINYQKSVLIPINISDLEARCLSQELKCLISYLPMKYLGIQLGANPRRIETWKPVLDKIKKKLSKWKSGLLSWAGRITMIRAFVQTTKGGGKKDHLSSIRLFFGVPKIEGRRCQQ